MCVCTYLTLFQGKVFQYFQVCLCLFFSFLFRIMTIRLHKDTNGCVHIGVSLYVCQRILAVQLKLNLWWSVRWHPHNWKYELNLLLLCFYWCVLHDEHICFAFKQQTKNGSVCMLLIRCTFQVKVTSYCWNSFYGYFGGFSIISLNCTFSGADIFTENCISFDLLFF